MTALAHRSRRAPTRFAAALSGVGPFVLIAVAVVAVGIASTTPAFFRVAMAVPAAALIFATLLKSPRRAVIVLLVWLAVLGTVRRLLISSGASGDSDPLLLVAPAVVGLLVVVAARQGAFRDQTRLTKHVLILSALVLFAALNPLQGSLAGGAAGLLFVLVPVLWFWIGRSLLDDALLYRVLRLVACLSAGAATYGLYQVYVGFPAWDSQWLETKGYAALHVGASVRPFASFASAADYVAMLAIGILIWTLLLIQARRALAATVVLGLLGWAVTVASVRHTLVIVPITIGIVLAVARGFGLARTALTGIGALFLVGFVVTRFDASTVGGDQTSALLSRQVSGLSDPFNPSRSTLPGHIAALIGGVRDGLRNPVGHGLGTVTIANEKLGVGSSQRTDSDPSNVAIAMGLPGLLVYGAVVILALRLAFRQAQVERDFLTLAALGIVLITVLSWLAGGNYATAPLPWLVLGWLDRRSAAANAAITT